ncbi:hypothetical protein [Caulobacter sp. UNC279MFTsu5.1]|uniref:hypothetical protein n=1 Tax=Caulobacter sp. UNC279MFTsu5.1 TaxID=1502775 RepID=UPI0008F20E43|nr:hypothetical protein [Caulobacter sp. UNC279MFTsu5.1]SFI55581.1 hypothetical protein SAMN02799626_00115 [Caulobacter sp. UNC279MFTsu5.1]
MTESRTTNSLVAKWTTPSAVLAACWFVLDHLVPDLLPKPPREAATVIAGVALALSLAAWARRGWSALNAQVPRPWWPRQPWRLGPWLRQRPQLHITTAAVEVIRGLTVLESAQVNLVIQRNLSRTRRTTTLRFDTARLELRQRRGKTVLRWNFAPEEAGGFLALPVSAGANDHVRIAFVGTGFPMAYGQLVDFEKPYELLLMDVEAEVGERRPLRGVLGVARYFWPGAPSTSALNLEPSTQI